MAGWDYIVVGAGPAGAALAWGLARGGYRVLVAEAAPRPGMKPCGRGIPDVDGLPFRVPRGCVVQRIEGAELYVDDEQAFSVTGLRGSIVDRTCLAESLLAEAGAELWTRAFYKGGRVRRGGVTVDAPGERTIIAGGHPWYPGERINAVQYILPGEWEPRLQIFFDTRLIGYYWIFPAGPGRVEVGVGGYAGMQELWSLLDRFLDRSLHARELRGRRVLQREGAQIAVGGVIPRLLEEWPVHIGEAAGFVYPLTGEGIRPSMISAVRLAEALARGREPSSILRGEPARAIGLQRRVLEAVKRMRPEERAELLLSVPERLHVKMALGRATVLDLVRALARKPWLIAKLGLRR